MRKVDIVSLKAWHSFSIDYFFDDGELVNIPRIECQAGFRFATGMVRSHYPKLFYHDPDIKSSLFNPDSLMLGSKEVDIAAYDLAS